MKRLLGFLLIGISLAIVVAIILALDGEPLVLRGEALNPEAVGQARELFRANDPRQLRRGDQREVVIPVSLLDEAANFLAGRYLKGRGAVILSARFTELRFTRALPAGRYLNLRVAVDLGEGEPRFRSAAIGSLPLPPVLVEKGILVLLRTFNRESEWNSARGAVRALAADSEATNLVVRYVWEPDLVRQARAVAFDPADLARIEFAQSALAAVLDHRAAGSPVPLAEVLQSLLADAGSDSRARRKAVLLVLGVYLYDKDLAVLIPQARQWPRPRRVSLMLARRHDSAQHFTISAALAAWAGEPAADAVGLYKELDDARRGSGFSFADLAADRAGTRFGEAIAQGAPNLEKAVGGKLTEAEFMPSLADLPEYLHEPEFRRRFGGPGSPAYRRLAEEIERRIAALPLYQ